MYNFNLLDDAWLQTDVGLKSLLEITDSSFNGDLITLPAPEQIAIFKFLLGIAQAAYTPKDTKEWKEHDSSFLKARMREYLNARHDKFYLYGDKPFLQTKAIEKKVPEKKQTNTYLDLQAFVPYLAYGNNALVTQIQENFEFTDAQLAHFIICIECTSLASKRVKPVNLSDTVKKQSTGKVSPFVGYEGSLHCYLVKENLFDTLYLNLLTCEDLAKLDHIFPGITKEGVLNRVGIAPWDLNIDTENCDDAVNYLKTYMSTLIPLVRFCHFNEKTKQICVTDGIYSTLDLSDFVDISQIVTKVKDKEGNTHNVPLALEPDYPLSLTLLPLLSGEQDQCLQLALVREKALLDKTCTLRVLGLTCSNTLGEQKISGASDFIDETIKVNSASISSLKFWDSYSRCIDSINEVATKLENCIYYYFSEAYHSSANLSELTKAKKSKARTQFFLYCTAIKQEILRQIEKGEFSEDLRKKIRTFALQSYDLVCSKQGKLLPIWQLHRPSFSKEI